MLTMAGSSIHRATRAAGWFDDFIRKRANKNMKSLVLLEGIKGWASAGEDYGRQMDGFVPETWKRMRPVQDRSPVCSTKSQQLASSK